MAKVKYWVAKKALAENESVVVAHFKSEEAVNSFINSSFFKDFHGKYGPGVAECVSFEIHGSAIEAEESVLGKLREAALAKLTKEEKYALGIKPAVVPEVAVPEVEPEVQVVDSVEA